MFCPLSHPTFAHHFSMCKTRTKHEMYLKVDKMVDRIYDQALNDLQHFFSFDQSILTEVHTSSGPSHFALHQWDTFIRPNVTHLTNTTFNPTLSHHLYQQNNEPLTFNPCCTRQASSTFPVPPPQLSFPNCRFTLPNELNLESPQVSIKQAIEIAEPANEPMETVQAQHSQSSLSTSNVNEQSNNNLNDEEEEICECDDCVNGIEIDQEVADDDDDSVQWIEDDQEDKVSSRLVKKLRLDTTRLNNEQSSVTRQSVIISTPKQTNQLLLTEANNPNPEKDSHNSSNNKPTSLNNSSAHNRQIITLSRQCPNCPRTFAKDKLRQHLWDEHSIDKYQCVVKDCAQSLNDKFILRGHIRNCHKHTAQFHCEKCHKNWPTYKQLYSHHNLHHQLGQFQCSFLQCTFTAEYREKVYYHYTREHKNKKQFHCAHCNYQTSSSNRLKIHQRAHLGIKPYRCKWPECDYASSYRQSIIRHIERMHFAKRNPNLYSNGAQLGDPKDYVEVATHLL